MKESSVEDYSLLEGAGAVTPAKATSCGPASIVVLLVVGALGTLGVLSLQPPLPPPPTPPVVASKDGSSVRLTITNGCDDDSLWLANFAFQAPFFQQDIRLAAKATHEFEIPDVGLAATRFWPKWGCDATGSNCKIGQSGGPGESCDASGCAPPIDSKFEATFGCMLGTKGCAHNPSLPTEELGPTDWWDVSQVDGWTLPYKVDVVGDCPMAPASIDCSRLSLRSCPDNEALGKAGNTTLRLRDPSGSGETVGCYSPCAKLTYSQWGQGFGFTPESVEAQNYCCPTPPLTPAACSAGPVEKTKFVKAVHELCPGVYAYAYDDGMGLAQCPAGTRYDVTFYCPI